MVKRVKQVKAKKIRLPRQPRHRKAALPRKPPVTNVTVHIVGSTHDLAGSHFFPNASNLVFTPTYKEASQVNQPPVYQNLQHTEPPIQMPTPNSLITDYIPEPSKPFPNLNLVTLGKKDNSNEVSNRSINSFFSSPVETPIQSSQSARGRGRPKSDLSVGNKKLPELQSIAEMLGVNYEGLNRTKLVKEISYAKQKQQKSY